MATKNAVSTTRQQQLDFLSQYGKAASRGQTSIIGKLLKFNKGTYVAGLDNEEIPIGTKVIVNVDSVLSGWTRWQNNRPVEQEMGPVIEGFQPLARSDLSMVDEAEWPPDEKGDVRDPWQFANQCLMKHAKTREMYTFTAPSKGAQGALGRLVTEATEYMIEGHDGEYPIVELNTDSYKHAKYGKIPIPVFKIVGWSSAANFKLDDKPVAKPSAVATKKVVPKKGKGDGRSLTYR